jgi:fructose 1,6-bisphosphatase
MKIEKVICWNLIDGFHQARIVDARLNKKCVNSKDEWELRLIFEITSLVHPTKQYVAKRVYRKGDSVEIIADLEHLLGDAMNKVINLAGEIISEALVILNGMPVDIEVEHIYGKDHDNPFCLVSQVRKPGVLIEQIRAAA